uniref:Uncharacterized protein n=1 Tax=Arundo donax TaxID=35708 RepID=A0A0A8ZS31_ARUDO
MLYIHQYMSCCHFSSP